MFKKSGKSNSKHKNSQEQKNEGVAKSGNRNNPKAVVNSDGEKEWKFDKKKVKCFNCQKYGHFAKECWKGEGANNKPKNQAHLAQDSTSDSEAMMLMARTNEDESEDASWFVWPIWLGRKSGS